ncbi:hypothetical protein [Arthrobacter bambusae]|uniref:hypothetical protein n=1 Tax=Arthrobacter bambusae TaxID=1338426 RepID=UPI0027801848|nr:hypothetical protein [Arthrobacter bambusae]MDQ0241198.1 hypothetical protein [Arthrobacter bambusae]
MTTFIPVNHFSYGTFTPLQNAILNRTDNGFVNYKSYGGPEVTAPLQSLSRAVESAFILVEKATLPKITHATPPLLGKRMFNFAGDPYVPYSTDPNQTSEQARKTAAKWLAIAAHLEAEEKAKSDEAKKKADAEAAAKVARAKELDRIATFHFGKPIRELSANKTSAVEEIYRLEQVIAEEGAA